MPTNITPVDAWTTPAQVPNNTESANQASLLLFAQPHDDRLLYLRNRVEACSSYAIGATALADSGDYTVASAGAFQATGFTLASNLVQVPAAGRYLISVYLSDIKSSDTANPKRIRTALRVGSTNVTVSEATRFSATAADFVATCIQWYIEITTPSSEKIGVRNLSSTGTIDAAGLLVIRRVT